MIEIIRHDGVSMWVSAWHIAAITPKANIGCSVLLSNGILYDVLTRANDICVLVNRIRERGIVRL